MRRVRVGFIREIDHRECDQFAAVRRRDVDRVVGSRDAGGRSVGGDQDALEGERGALGDDENIAVGVSDDARRDAAHHHPLEPAQTPPPHHDQVAALVVGQMHDPLPGLALLEHGFQRHALGLGERPRLGQDRLAGLAQRGSHIAEADAVRGRRRSPGTTVAAVSQHFSSRASAKDWTSALRPDSEPSSETRILRYLPTSFSSAVASAGACSRHVGRE